MDKSHTNPVTVDTWMEVEKLHDDKNERRHTHDKGVEDQLHEGPVILLTDTIVDPIIYK